MAEFYRREGLPSPADEQGDSINRINSGSQGSKAIRRCTARVEIVLSCLFMDIHWCRNTDDQAGG
jgi:hypothetical protein